VTLDGSARGEVVLYAAVSLDGSLAEAGDGLGFLDDVTDAGQTYEAFLAQVGALLMGRRTYEVARSVQPWPYPGLPCVVVTAGDLDDRPCEVSTDAGHDLPGLVARLREHGRVWVVGGGVLVRQMLADGLLDELDLTVTPHLLGGGVPLWGERTGRHRLRLVETRQFSSGAMRLRYLVDR
jgi:dihydrofolate reductase